MRTMRKTIAKRLNDEHVPGPAGREWRDTTIRGQVDRGTGLLNNTLYIGRLEWNRTAYVKNPQTGKKVARVNDPKAREIVEVPELRIIRRQLGGPLEQLERVVQVEAADCELGSPLEPAKRRAVQPRRLVAAVAPGELRDRRVDRLGVVVGERAGAYVSLLIDDPALPHAINANLFQSNRDGQDHHLLWNRASRTGPRS